MTGTVAVAAVAAVVDVAVDVTMHFHVCVVHEPVGPNSVPGVQCGSVVTALWHVS